MRIPSRGMLKHVALPLGLVLAWGVAGVRAADVGSGVFRAVQAVEAQLKRGVSTKADVQQLLGVPNGSGAALLPTPEFNRERALKASEAGFFSSSDFGQKELWYYEDIEITDLKSTEGVYVANMRQQLLLIFFKGDVFDGYFWTTNRAAGELSR